MSRGQRPWLLWGAVVAAIAAVLVIACTSCRYVGPLDPEGQPWDEPPSWESTTTSWHTILTITSEYPGPYMIVFPTSSARRTTNDR